MKNSRNQLLVIFSKTQQLHCYEGVEFCFNYQISTAKNGLGEQVDSECTPRGWHQIHKVIGRDNPNLSVYVGRKFTGEIYSQALADQFPERDWILTRILQLEGLELGFNQGDTVDTLDRLIYIHGTPDTQGLGSPTSRGCIRMASEDIIRLADWVEPGARVYIE